MKTAKDAPVISAAGTDRALNTHPDIPDLRDRIYEPALLELAVGLALPSEEDLPVLDQKREGACTGFAMAAAINLLLARTNRKYGLDGRQVSARMLYEMAKIHDEWPGETYEGSSVRGAMKGFFHNGVCSDAEAPYREESSTWHLTVDQAKDARKTGLGAYYRLRPMIIDYHSALNEVGAIVVSANVHRGWRKPPKGIIKLSRQHEGGHAFVIVGYDQDGFLVQNSWGEDWGGYQGRPGTAHWSYADWAENVIDAWVMRLAVPTPGAFDLTHTGSRRSSIVSDSAAIMRPTPRRHDIIGHVIHIDDGDLQTDGRYGTDLATIKETAKFLTEDSAKDKPDYDHLLIYAHGGLNGPDASARRIAAMKPIFKRNNIYPVHIMWETGFTEELGDVFKNAFTRSEERVGFGRDALDWMIEKTSRGIGRAVWRETKRGAEKAFQSTSHGGGAAIAALLKANAISDKPKKIHLVGHSAGSILLGELLRRWGKLTTDGTSVDTMALMAPACTMAFYEGIYRRSLGDGGAKIVSALQQFNLIDKRELEDTVGPYGKSLLYFVSRAFEENKDEPLLGMEIYSEDISLPDGHELFYAGRHSSKSDSSSHGGFDNDRKTMNSVLAQILGKKPSASLGFQEEEMVGY